MFCQTCGSKLLETARFCSGCGTAVNYGSGETLLNHGGQEHEDATLDGAAAPARTAAGSGSQRRARTPAPSGTLSSSDPITGGRFVPGQIVAERYRIVALAGRGGMGEVYRAEDLKLDQAVAIKFLPVTLSQDAPALARFHSEVRIARQVSHPNVCRVFDIGEAEGVPFLTMEYVDGEDLASVVRRIGRLSPDKAVELARQVCAGLAAAHERGVIHRDLKPANVMLDGAGKARIMDFGLAGVAASFKGSEIRAGTPAYMAPEQLAGAEVTAKSDLYSLGLILYELLTGKRAFEAATLPELIKRREEGTLTSPSTLVRDLDPLIERVILRCLEKDPSARPASALQVAAALPGGDPLAAALAAGETPSPEMVAAAGASEGMRPPFAVALLATVLVGLLAYCFAYNRFRLQNIVPADKSPDVLIARSQEIIRLLGLPDAAADSAHGFQHDVEYLNYIRDHDKTATRWNRFASGRPAPLQFWYRQSPLQMQPLDFFGFGEASPSNPALDVTGMMNVVLDLQGRLLEFRRIPRQHDTAPPAQPPNWQALLAPCGIDLSAYTPATPEWTPLLFADSRAAWTRTLSDPPGAIERVEAAAYRGAPVYIDVRYPWNAATRDLPLEQSAQQRYATWLLVALFLAIFGASVAVVRRNRRLKRGDEAGATRLASFITITALLAWLLRSHHIAAIGEVNITMIGVAWATMVAALARLLYLALEPFVRRHDPHTIISWTRLLAGKTRDPLVGRDVLIGATYGVLLSIFESADNYILPLFGKLPPTPNTPFTDSLLGIRLALSAVFQYVWVFVLYSLLVFFLLFLLRLAVRKDWIAGLVIVFLGAITNTGGEYPLWTFVASAAVWLSIYFMLRRFGLVAVVVGLVIQNILAVFPITSHFDRWYASGALTGLAVIAAIAIFAFRAALAGQPLFSENVLDH
jgi:serine/threonine-protein kinase